MDPNGIIALIQQLPYGAHLLIYLPPLVMVCSILDASIPQQAPGTAFYIPRRIISYVAISFGHAANRLPGDDQPPPKA